MGVELRESTLQEEGPLQVSKWLSLQMLLDGEEMASLLESCQPLIFCGSAVVAKGKSQVFPEGFLHVYRDYVEELKQGRLPNEALYRQRFNDLWTLDTGMLYAISLQGDRELVKACGPVVQLQAHFLGYSSLDKRFRPMVMGKDAIAWGIQFSYPQIFQDNRTREILPIAVSPRFPNTALFRAIQRWIRKHTIPTPFVVNGELTHVPIRLGKECLTWINHHPQLQEQGISVKCVTLNA